MTELKEHNFSGRWRSKRIKARREETQRQYEEAAAQRAEHDEDYEVEYTGREIHSHVKYVERGPKFGLAEGWVIMTVKPYRKVPE